MSLTITNHAFCNLHFTWNLHQSKQRCDKSMTISYEYKYHSESIELYYKQNCWFVKSITCCMFIDRDNPDVERDKHTRDRLTPSCNWCFQAGNSLKWAACLLPGILSACFERLRYRSSRCADIITHLSVFIPILFCFFFSVLVNVLHAKLDWIFWEFQSLVICYIISASIPGIETFFVNEIIIDASTVFNFSIVIIIIVLLVIIMFREISKKIDIHGTRVYKLIWGHMKYLTRIMMIIIHNAINENLLFMIISHWWLKFNKFYCISNNCNCEQIIQLELEKTW